MTKRIFSIFAVLGIAATMFLSGCTAAGVECGLIGKWERDYSGAKGSYEFTSDDKMIVEVNGVKVKEHTVKLVLDHTIVIDEDGVNKKIEYRNLGCDSVELKFDGDWLKFTKAN
ncbi:MAG: hypothetical protein J1G30_01890 [Spirochaetales bacterium]|nr:hypothetical protein [Spirochaetales bacterium]